MTDIKEPNVWQPEWQPETRYPKLWRVLIGDDRYQSKREHVSSWEDLLGGDVDPDKWEFLGPNQEIEAGSCMPFCEEGENEPCEIDKHFAEADKAYGNDPRKLLEGVWEEPKDV